MEQEIKNIKFDNRKKPEIQFDLLNLDLKNLLKRKDIDHDPRLIHRVDFYLILIVTSGSGQHVIDFTEYPYEKGTILTIRKDQVHRFVENDAKGYILLFTDQFLVRYLEQLEVNKTLQLFNELLASPRIRISEEEQNEIFHLIEEMSKEFFVRYDEQSEGILRSQLHILISKLYRYKQAVSSNIGDGKYLKEFIHFQQLVETQCFQTKRVKDFALQMGLSTKTLNHITRHIVGKSAKTFIDEILILKIKRQLVNSTLSIKEIAYKAGFEEPSNLYKYFRKFTHQTPEAFRKANR